MNKTASYLNPEQASASDNLHVIQARAKQADTPDAVQLWAQENGFTLAALSHCLQASTLRDVSGTLHRSHSAALHGMSQGDAQMSVQHALQNSLPFLREQIEHLHGPNGYRLSIVQGARAHTLHGARPVVTLPALDTVADLILLAHEVGHALQLILTSVTPPPVFRELAAFVAERILVKSLAQSAAALASPANDVLLADDVQYCVNDRVILSRAVYCGAADYDYRWNYPIPRAVSALDAILSDAEAVFRADRTVVTRLFSAAGVSLW